MPSDRGVGVSIIDTVDLSVTSGHQSGLVPRDVTVSVVFDAIDPFRTDNLPILRTGNNFPSSVLLQRIVFVLHSLFPVRRVRGSDSFLMRSGFSRHVS